MVSVRRWELSDVTHTMYHRDGGKWALYEDIKAVVQEAYERGRQEGLKQNPNDQSRFNRFPLK